MRAVSAFGHPQDVAPFFTGQDFAVFIQIYTWAFPQLDANSFVGRKF